MSQELVAAFNTDNYEDLAKLTGTYVSTASYIPLLQVNKKAITKGKQVLVSAGTYQITQDEVSVFAETALFRPFINTFQYKQYDATENRFLNKSIIIKNFREDPIDELGGLKCGHISFKEKELLKKAGLFTPEQEARQRSIKCYRTIYGTITMEDAVTETGEKYSLVDLPVMWRTAGTNFNAANNALKAIEKMRHLPFQHNLLLGVPTEAEAGSNTYYLINAEPVLNETIPFTTEDGEVFKMFQETIDRENKYVTEKWRQANGKNEVFDLEADALKELELNDDLSDL